MEGIFDGGATDSCFYCSLLHPSRRGDCSRCGSRMRYVPATMMGAPRLEALVRAQIEAYRRARLAAEPVERLEELVTLLELLHRYQPQSLDILRDSDLDLGQLRADYDAATG